MVTLSLASGSGTPGSAVTLALSIASTGGDQCAAIQWNFVPQSGISLVSIALGAAGIAANKDIYTFGNQCIVSGNNQNTISNGVLVSATFSIASWATGTLTIALSGLVASDASANSLTSSSVPSSVIVSSSPPTKGNKGHTHVHKTFSAVTSASSAS